MASKLFVFNRDLPEPFEKLPKKSVAVRSMYSDGTTDARLENKRTRIAGK